MRKSICAFISLDLKKSLLVENPHFSSKPPENWSKYISKYGVSTEPIIFGIWAKPKKFYYWEKIE